MLKILEFTLTYLIYIAHIAAFVATVNLRKNSYEIFSKLCKTNPIFPHFSTKNNDFTKKNKPNSNPIQSQTNPILAQKSGGQTQTKPIQNLSSIGAYLLFCRGAKMIQLELLLIFRLIRL